ncbi:cytochrome ubiquinol oxidase subunit I [Evansella cellulosilytica]|uniref:Cytochrome bd ubiquinol oxidase subunit I n=1 Tax=Evansella cellulosilytica (strain ATCC 21833 / DSM 2522 / FERM P-1141 / JCM 9156 / N-4) TaxID=649639 RepID=E6TRA2_EVAC2|nr:cytochrome ubiquinol oxidase subunit I [Evansella cellulosilytica]ADU30614.1 cytochrome bd ubiquinol oxidase subunit I [Evansella cellulosilytica DSM 2522]
MIDDPVTLSRLLTFITLGFHIILATVGVGIPIFISIAEFIGIKKKDHHYILLAKRWARGYTILVAVGVVTGTIIGFQLSLLWPTFMQAAGKIIALPLFMETFAFFFEAIFLGIYLYTWNRFKKPIYHWLLSIPIVIGSSASAFFITTVNAFMNTPNGFDVENGVFTNIQPLVAMFNASMPSKMSHVLTTAYLTSAFILAAIAAFHLLRNKSHQYYKKALHLTMIGCFVFSIATMINGDISGKFLAKYQPEKLAAAEWHFETEENATLLLGGILDPDEREVKFGIEIPYALSILAFNRPSAEVIGLNEFPEELWPPLYIHYFFNIMIFIGMFLAAVSFIYLVFYYFNRFNSLNRWLLRAIVIGAPLAILSIEAGWIMTEVGRQPWILRGFLMVEDTATTSNHVFAMLVLFSLLYISLAILLPTILIRLFKKKDAEKELEEHHVIL